MNLRKSFESRTSDFAKFKTWLYENCQRKHSADWETDSFIYTAFIVPGFRLDLETCKEAEQTIVVAKAGTHNTYEPSKAVHTMVDDRIIITILDPTGDYDNDFEVAYIYNLSAPGLKVEEHLAVDDSDALCRLEQVIASMTLAKDLEVGLSNKPSNINPTKKLKV